MTRRPRALAPALALLAAAALAAPAPAQERNPGDGDDRWFPAAPAFAPLLAAPLETGLRGAFLIADRPDLDDEVSPDPGDGPAGRDDFAGANIEADVALGLRLPVVRLREETAGGPELVLGFETGVFTRFYMETPEKDLVNADFRVGAPLSARWRAWEGRLELRHVSSHYGDDFIRRFDPPFRQISLEGFELLVARRFAGAAVRAYAGGEANFQVSDRPGLRAGTERTAARWGLEFDPGGATARRGPSRPGGDASDAAGARDAPTVWPFAAADFRITSATDEVAGTGVAGVGFRLGGVGLRLETRGHFGPSSMGQLRMSDEVYWGLGLRIEPRG